MPEIVMQFFVTVDDGQSESSNINLRALTSLEIILKIKIVLAFLFGPNKLC